MNLGKLITDVHAKKDAIHVPIAPAIASCILHPGQKVLLHHGLVAHPYKPPLYHGVVDPFLEEPVDPGQWFWVLITPGSASNLRHEWDHPAFINPKPVSMVFLGEDEEDRKQEEWCKENRCD